VSPVFVACAALCCPRVCVVLFARSDCSLSFKIEAVIEEEVAGMDLDNDGIIELHELKAYQAKKVCRCSPTLTPGVLCFACVL
jgi:hypothetical protein